MASGLCECGCGGQTPLASQTHRAKGWIKGQPIRFIKGHSGHKYRIGDGAIADRWRIEDCGFETPCWVWLLAKKAGGYGNVMAEGRSQVAHRYYYEQIHGKLPRHTHLDHLCRNRACVNPDHLEPVTPAENSRRGSNAKVSLLEVQQIRSLMADGWRAKDIAYAFGISDVQVYNIRNRKSWATS